MFVSRLPNYRIGWAVDDIVHHAQTSPYKYLQQSGYVLPWMRNMAEPLDVLTRDGFGLDVDVISDPLNYWVADFYGSRLQNRIWNFLSQPSARPGAIVIQSLSAQPLLYIGPVLSIQKIFSGHEYVVISKTKFNCLLLSRQVLDNPVIKQRLLHYYEMTFPAVIAQAKEIDHRLPEGVDLRVSIRLGFGFRYLQLKNELHRKFIWSD